jgi:FkbM family methyltransferase
VSYLRRHVALNGLANVHIIEAAVADLTGHARMAPGPSPSEASLTAAGPWLVPAIALDEWRRRAGAPLPGLIKIDVEGAEDRVLSGAIDVLSVAHPTIFLALHGERQRQVCRTLLESAGYRIASLNAGRDALLASEWLAE